MTKITIKSKIKLKNESKREIIEWMENFKSRFNFNNPPVLIHNQDEFLLSLLTGLWLLQFFKNKKVTKSCTSIFDMIEELKSKYPQSNSLWIFLNEVFNHLNKDITIDTLLHMKIPDLHDALLNDTLGTMLQHSLSLDDRKRLAANYTTKRSAKILVELIKTESPLAIIDPFCGSGRLVSAYLESLPSNFQFPLIRINDLMPSAVLIAYSRLILILTQFDQEYGLLQASIGDSFVMFPSNRRVQPNDVNHYDLVLMNPPFTRTHRINSNQRNNLQKLKQKYESYLIGQVGLHIYAIFLADTLIKENGVLATVLPAATILSKYSKGVHELLLNNFQLEIIAASEDEKSCSEDSDFREIFLVAKRKRVKKEKKVQFLRISNLYRENKWKISSINKIPKKTLADEWNWTKFLGNPELLKIREILLQSDYIKSGKNLNLDIVRGVEMYGPNFFFIPNTKWQIVLEKKDEIIIKCDEKLLRIPKEFLVQSLRKPGNYTHLISPKVSDFALSIPNSRNEKQRWLKDYLRVSEQFAHSAKRKFGRDWKSHINHQIKTKKPWGHLFFIDKFGISTTSVMGHFFESKLICSKNFYVLRNSTPDQAKLLTAWLNSTFFIILYLLSRREIGGSYGRLQIIDYMKEPLFLDVSEISKSQKEQIIKEFDTMRKLNLPPIPEQLQLPQRKTLDRVIIQSLHLSEKVEKRLLTEIYPLLERTFKSLKHRDKSR